MATLSIEKHDIVNDIFMIRWNDGEKYRPKKWLFPGQDNHKHITPGTVDKVFTKACWIVRRILRTGIQKQVSVHSLRHSPATHLLKSGTDLRYIQSRNFGIGHKSSKTTEIYTHVSKQSIGRIKSPLDSLD
ncbi:MAG: tyrosine-type recombinase/integrase, partial [Candidatus Marinimicrobia bacterium]|nr:tyrosine-type recombinase/integrase [Candidatus Neomarinimicrobiota bacterium]